MESDGAKVPEADASDAWSSCSTADTAEAAAAEAASSFGGGYVPGNLLQQTARGETLKPPMGVQPEGFVGDAVGVAAREPKLPSIGSAGHAFGTCKPCEFFHRTHCRAGENCKFCHLCGPGEPKLRKNQKHAAMRAARQQEQELASSNLANSC
jgi:hypothetical protein